MSLPGYVKELHHTWVSFNPRAPHALIPPPPHLGGLKAMQSCHVLFYYTLCGKGRASPCLFPPLASLGFRPFRDDSANCPPLTSFPAAASPSPPSPPGDPDVVMGDSEDEDFGKIPSLSPDKKLDESVREDVSRAIRA